MTAEFEDNTLTLEENASPPSTPSSGESALYPLNTGALYYKDASGNVHLVPGPVQLNGVVQTLIAPQGRLTNLGNGAVRVDVLPRPTTRQWLTINGIGAGFAIVNGRAFTTVTPGAVAAASQQTESNYTLLSTSATTATVAGIYCSAAQFTITRRELNPRVVVRMRTGASIANMRFFIGFSAAIPANADAPGTSFVGLRYSTVAPDAGWVGLASNGSSTSTTAALSGGTLAVSTSYLLSARVQDGIAYFSVNNGVETALATNLPAASTLLGYAIVAITNENVLKTISISRLSLQYD